MIGTPEDLFIYLAPLAGRVWAVAWLDDGTHESLLQVAAFVQTVQERQGMIISRREETTNRNGFVDREQRRSSAVKIANKTGHGQKPPGLFPIQTKQLQSAARRPAFSALSTAKLEEHYGLKMLGSRV